MTVGDQHSEMGASHLPMSLTDIASLVNGKISGDPDKLISGVDAFETAGEDDITLALRPSFFKRLDTTAAGAVIVPRMPETSAKNLVIVENPPVAFAKIVERFKPMRDSGEGIDPTASVAADLSSSENLYVGPCAVIAEGVRCGDRVRIHAGAVIGAEVTLGDDVTIHANVTVGERCCIGNRVIIHAGTVIGSDGFGFAPDGEAYVKIPQTGIVQIDDDVEIGANNTIDRATFGKTWIQEGVKTDNLVQIAHNVVVGAHSFLVAQVGISGSTTLGRHAILAGQAGVAGHLQLGDNVIVGPQAGVAKSIESGQTVSGSPELPHRLWLRITRIIPRLPDILKRVAKLEKRVDQIEK